MAAKKCQKCGKTNPHFFTHCVDCGAKLNPDNRDNKQINNYIKTGLIIVLCVILILIIILPAARFSHSFAQDFSKKVSSSQVSDSPIPEYMAGNPAANNDFQITISSARDGQNTYNSNKFFLVSVYMKNNRTNGNLKISGSDFELIDSDGSKYLPYSIGSKILYDLNPSQSTSGELTFIIPQKATAEKILFTFPATDAATSKRDIVIFSI